LKEKEARDNRRFTAKVRAYKDPILSKRSPSSYILFSQEHQKTLREKHPEMKVTEISKLIGTLWAALTPEQKKVYSDRTLQLKEQLRQEKEKYRQSHPLLKKPTTPFALYVQEKFAKAKEALAAASTSTDSSPQKVNVSDEKDAQGASPSLSTDSSIQKVRVGDVVKILSQEWKKLGTDGQAPYKHQFEQLRSEYDRKIHAFTKKAMAKLTPKQYERAQQLFSQGRALNQKLVNTVVAEATSR